LHPDRSPLHSLFTGRLFSTGTSRTLRASNATRAVRFNGLREKTGVDALALIALRNCLDRRESRIHHGLLARSVLPSVEDRARCGRPGIRLVEEMSSVCRSNAGTEEKLARGAPGLGGRAEASGSAGLVAGENV
jgi:hypothetical protein